MTNFEYKLNTVHNSMMIKIEILSLTYSMKMLFALDYFMFLIKRKSNHFLSPDSAAV